MKRLLWKSNVSIQETIQNYFVLTEYLQLSQRKAKLKKSPTYYTQCVLQMALTGTIKKYFFVLTPHGMIVYGINFDDEIWCSMKNTFLKTS